MLYFLEKIGSLNSNIQTLMEQNDAKVYEKESLCAAYGKLLGKQDLVRSMHGETKRLSQEIGEGLMGTGVQVDFLSHRPLRK
jgi:flavorubredoxin